MRKRNLKALILCTVFFFTNFYQSLACTGVIVGKDVSLDGNAMIGRTEDWSSCYNKTLKVTPAKTWNKGDMFEDVYNFTYPMPQKTYKYISIPDGYQNEGDIFEAAGWNEMGVTMTATVTASAHEKALEVDPLTDNGIYESSVVSVVLPRIKTAREGVELLAEIMDTKGVQEGASVVIADQNEIWYMELLTGHQYCAIKYPDDRFSVFPNCFMLGKVDVNDKQNVIASKDLVNLPRKHGFLVEEDGMINIKKTYAEPLSQGCRDRLWGGINFLDEDKNIPYDAEEFDFFQKTDKKISLKNLMKMQRYRYEGTSKDANLPENHGKVRAIGTVEQEEAHIIQIKPNYPKNLGGVMWVAMGNAEHAMYVPIYGVIDDVIEPYKVMGNQYSPDSAYWSMREVSALSGINRELYGSYVREYFDKEEQSMIAEQNEIDNNIVKYAKENPQKAVEYATKVSQEYQKKAYEDAKTISKELKTYFFDMAGDDAKKKEEEGMPYIPSLLGEKRREEIIKERGLEGKSKAAQPLAKSDEEVNEDAMKIITE